MDKLVKKEFRKHIVNWLKKWKRWDLKYTDEQKYFLNIFRKIIWWDYRHNKGNYSTLETEIFWLLNENQVSNIEKYIKWDKLDIEIETEIKKIGNYIFNLLSSISHHYDRSSFSVKRAMYANMWNSGLALEYFLLYFFKLFSKISDIEFRKSDIELEAFKIDHLITYNNKQSDKINIASQISITKYLDNKREQIIKANLDLQNENSDIYKLMNKDNVLDIYSFLLINWNLWEQIRKQASKNHNFLFSTYKKIWNWKSILENIPNNYIKEEFISIGKTYRVVVSKALEFFKNINIDELKEWSSIELNLEWWILKSEFDKKNMIYRSNYYTEWNNLLYFVEFYINDNFIKKINKKRDKPELISEWKI